jgi:hypothetical protein
LRTLRITGGETPEDGAESFIVIDPLLLVVRFGAHPPLAVILRSNATKDLLLART